MNSQIRDLQNGFLGLPKLRCELLAILVNDSTTQNQVSIKPSMPQSSSISRYVKLLGGFEFSLRDRCQSQTWAVSMGTNNLKPSVGGFEVLANVKGYQCSVVSGEEVLGAFLELPVGGLAQFLISF